MLLLRLSTQGQEVVAQLSKTAAERHERILSALTEDEQQALIKGLSALIRAFRTA